MKNYIYILSFFLLSITSCEDIVDPEELLENNESLVIINSFISPQNDVISAKISSTEFIIGQPIDDSNSNERLIIKNAVVTLSNEEGLRVNLPYFENNFRYEIPATNFSIVAGKKYFLKVLVEEKEFNASCEIPTKKINSITEIVSDKEDSNQEEVKVVRVRFTDIVDQENFYIVGAHLQRFNSGTSVQKTPFNFETDRFVTDNIGDGSIMSSEGKLKKELFVDTTNIKIQVANVEHILYKFLFSSYLNNQNEGSPIEEVIIPPNNIIGNGGQGVFAGFQITEKQVSL